MENECMSSGGARHPVHHAEHPEAPYHARPVQDIESTIPRTGTGEQVRRCPLAVAGLISSLVFCCPVTTIAAVILGVLSHVRISRNPFLTGRGMATTAVCIGILSSLFTIPFSLWVYRTAVFVTGGSLPAAAPTVKRK